jgi:hypothetical protein
MVQQAMQAVALVHLERVPLLDNPHITVVMRVEKLKHVKILMNRFADGLIYLELSALQMILVLEAYFLTLVTHARMIILSIGQRETVLSILIRRESTI